MTRHERRERSSESVPAGVGTIRAGARRAARVGGARVCALRALLLAWAALGLACSASDSGGMSGTGISQGSINSFGSIFVNGVEWTLDRASILIDGNAALETDLRVGMVVQIRGDLAADGLTGRATLVEFDDRLEGPISSNPVDVVAGLSREFTVLGTTVVIRTDKTVFDDGATFAGLALNDVVAISGYLDWTGAVQATRVQRKGTFPALSDAQLRATVTNLQRSGSSGSFQLGTILVHFDATTQFSDLTVSTLANNDLVQVTGHVRTAGAGDEVDAARIKRLTTGLGTGDSPHVKLEGIVVLCAAAPLDYCLDGTPVDDTTASFEPNGFTPAPGNWVEVEGRLQAGRLVAEKVKSESPAAENVNTHFEAAISAVDAANKTLTLLGVAVTIDADTRLEDESSLGDDSLTFGELHVGDFVRVDASQSGNTVRAVRLERDDATVGNADVILEGAVTSLDRIAPSLAVLGQALPLGPATEYRDALGQTRTEDQFFRNPGDVSLGDFVRARDRHAASLSTFSEIDDVEIQ